MKELIGYEIHKYRKQWLIILILTGVMLAYYVSHIFIDMDMYAGWSVSAFLNKEDYHNYEISIDQEVVDEDFINSLDQEYQEMVNAHRKSDEEILQVLKEDKQTSAMLEDGGISNISINDILYDPDYAWVVISEDFYNSQRMMDFQDRKLKLVQLKKDSYSIIEEMEYYGIMDTYNDAQQKEIIERLGDAFSKTELVTGYHNGWDVLISVGQFLPMTLGLVLLVALSSLFANDRERGMTDILRTTRMGRRKLVMSKLFMGFFLTTAIWMLFQAVVLIAAALVFGLQGAECTVLSWMNMPSIYLFNYMQYYLWQLLFSYLGTLVFALMVCCFSSLFSMWITLPLGLAVTLVTGFTSINNAEAFSFIQKLQMLTPAQVMSSLHVFFNYQSFSLGSFQIQLPVAMLLAMGVESMLFVGVLMKREG